ncbi:MAG: penicillin-binding protein 2, partial [Gammaproteobacteria bacterium]|nr:penicillin-binding protein 2 [Gammaproteobacteria bacterium]
HGIGGHHQVVVNAQGRSLQSIEGIRPQPGNDLFLTLDMHLQEAAELALQGKRGAAVAIDPRDGSIRALVSAPAYDPNLFGEGFTRRQFRSLSGNDNQPLFNRAIGGRYPPGSTIKPILGLAALQYAIRKPSDAQFCPGYYMLPGDDHRYRDWKKEGHGEVHLSSAIEESCDIYFYELALELDIDRIHKFMSQFGFGQLTGIDIRGENPGLLPSRDWKRRSFSLRAEQVWFPGETIITGIGQGFMLATPLQLAHATAIIAARGKRFKPRLISAVRDPISGQRVPNPPVELPAVTVSDPDYWEIIVEAMADVVHGEHGTAIASGYGLKYRMAGKTGTSQIFSIGQEDEYDAEEVEERLRHHALFIAFAPLEDPEIAIAVIIENAGSGAAAAAPVARAMFDAWFSQSASPVIATSNKTQ